MAPSRIYRREPPRPTWGSMVVVNRLARAVLVAGVLLLAYGVAQLWGTNLAEAQAQQQLSGIWSPPHDLEPQPNLAIPIVAAAPAPGPAATPPPTSTIDDPVLARPGLAPTLPHAEQAPAVPQVEQGQAVPQVEQVPAVPQVEQAPAVPQVEQGQAVARLEIPAIDLAKTVVFGTDRASLQVGPGLYPSAAWPGRSGNSAIAGHRTTYGAPFRRIDELRPGDEIVVETADGRFIYLVDAPSPALEAQDIGHVIVAPEAVQVLADHGDNRLTLTSCHPLFSDRQRIVVTASLLGPPADARRPLSIVDSPGPESASQTHVVAQTALRPASLAGARAATRPELLPTASTALPQPGVDVAGPSAWARTWSAHWSKPWWLVLRWALTSGAIAAISRLVARWWGRWPTYAMAAPPLTLSLVTFFVCLDRALPL